MKKILIFLYVVSFAFVACSTNGGGNTRETYLRVNIETIEFDANGGVKSVLVESNVDYTVSPNVDWLSVERTDNSTIKVTAAPSKAADVRKGAILISNAQYSLVKGIKVSQQAYTEPVQTNGWAEMPTMPNATNLEYCFHDKLPSNNNLRNYSFCFDKEKHCALWVAYPLHECYIDGDGGRTDAWSYDPCCVNDNDEPNLRNSYYSQGGGTNTHSRGHQLPSADRLASDADNATTFYYTNMTPQLQSLNGGTWASLENELRKHVCSDTLYIVTGAHFQPGVSYDYAWDNKGSGKACAVPTHYYKVILRTKRGNSGKWVGNCSADELQCAGFWFEHKGGAPRQTMSVAEIESKTGLTFFPNVKNAPKSIYDASDWQ